MNVLTVAEVVDRLRGRFHRCRYAQENRDYEHIAQAMGIAKSTLYRFAKGGSAHEEVLTKIEFWCQRQEARDA